MVVFLLFSMILVFFFFDFLVGPDGIFKVSRTFETMFSMIMKDYSSIFKDFIFWELFGMMI